jgi:hypothetical protein
MKRLLAAFAMASLVGTTAQAAMNTDPTWPCIQRKVPELSLGQIWNGPELPASAKNWDSDREVAELVAELSARRIPIAQAQETIRELPQRFGSDDAPDQLTKLAQGLFDHMNRERSQVISGIGRYAGKQRELAARLRKEASELGALQTQPNADIKQVTLLTDRLTWETRIFEERVQSLTYVCEVPTIIEQRLYALAKTILEVLPKK